MLDVFQMYVYAFLYPGATLSSMTSYVGLKFDVLQDVLFENFSISTSVAYFLFVEKVYKWCSVSLSHRVTLSNLVELDMLNFDVIVFMDWFPL